MTLQLFMTAKTTNRSSDEEADVCFWKSREPRHEDLYYLFAGSGMDTHGCLLTEEQAFALFVTIGSNLFPNHPMFSVSDTESPDV